MNCGIGRWGMWPRRHMMMRRFSGLPRGFARLVILDALKDGPAHGYELARKISERCGGWYFPSSGLIYPTLSLLEDMGYARVVSKEGKRVYEITDEGRKYLEAHKDELQAFSKRGMPMRPNVKAIQLGSELGALALAIRHLGILSSEEKVEQARKVLEEARKRIEELGEKPQSK